MLCTSCGRREADVFIEHTFSGKTSKTALCGQCAENFHTPKEIKPRRSSQRNSVFEVSIKNTHSDASCSLCSLTLDEIVSSGALGCPNCYRTFAKELSPVISYIHGSARHRGKAPKKYAERIARATRLSALRGELCEAVKNQLFEKCIILRDEITSLEKECDADVLV